MNWDIETPGVFHATKVQNFRANRGKFKHFFISYKWHLPGQWHDAGICTKHPVYIGVDLTRAAANATAVVSEPPRPRVVMSLVSWATPWKPATIGIAPSASAS